MIIDFKDLELNVAQNFKGGEKEYKSRRFVDENNKPVRVTTYEKHGLLKDMD